MPAGEGSPAIVSLFGREHVADLEMRWTIGREAAAIDRTIERVGVVFQIATRMTSWVAVDEVRAVDPASGSRRVVQPQELPHGTTLSSFGLAGDAPAESATMTRAGALKVNVLDALRAYGSAPGGGPPPPAQAPPPRRAAGAPLQKKGSAPPSERALAKEEHAGAPVDRPVAEPSPMALSESSLERAPRARRTRWLAALLVALLLLAVVAALVWLLTR